MLLNVVYSCFKKKKRKKKGNVNFVVKYFVPRIIRLLVQKYYRDILYIGKAGKKEWIKIYLDIGIPSKLN